MRRSTSLISLLREVALGTVAIVLYAGTLLICFTNRNLTSILS